MPTMQTPNNDSVEVSPVYVSYALNAGMTGGGAGGGGGLGGQHNERDPGNDNEVDFIEVSYRPTPRNCADANFLLDQATRKKAEYDTMKNIFANDHADFVLKLTPILAGVAAALGLGAGPQVLWNKVMEVANAAKLALEAEAGVVIGIGTAAVITVIYIDRDRWDIAVQQAQADQARLCGSSQT